MSPVSYTHLDVYKRQVFGQADIASESGESGDDAGGLDAPDGFDGAVQGLMWIGSGHCYRSHQFQTRSASGATFLPGRLVLRARLLCARSALPSGRGRDVYKRQPLMSGFRAVGSTAPAERFYVEAEFYNDTERSYFAEMTNYIKQTLGSRSLIIDTADHSHSGSGYPVLLATLASDVMDGHTYWQHPEMYVRKSPMVNDPFNSTVVELLSLIHI